MSPRLAFALDAATNAGRLTLAHFQAGVTVDIKDDSTPVTVADRQAESAIRSLVARNYPGELILGEEQGGDQGLPNRWVVDPIDGTKSFISGVPLYATLLSYEVNFEPVLGVAFFPALNEIIYAEVGSGTFLNGRPVRVSNKGTVSGSVICCGGHKTMSNRGRSEGFAKLVEKALASRTWGDAYGHALVAAGRVEAMIDPEVKRWDVSAMKIIVEEAGGKCTSFTGGPALTTDERLEAISTNSHVHSEVLEAFSQ